MKIDKNKLFAEREIKEIARYGFAGITTTFLNLAVYHLGTYIGFPYKYANIIAIFSSKTYGYVVNKKVVFCTHCSTVRNLMKEIFIYFLTRGFTGLIDYFGLICLVELFGANKIRAKYSVQLIVIILNYFCGKYITFNKRRQK